MKKLFFALFFYFLALSMFGQNPIEQHQKYYKLSEGSLGSGLFRNELFSDVDTTWAMWKNRSYNFGLDTNVTPMYTMVNSILATPYMVQVRGNENERNKKRWGFHVFEGYAKDDKSRITLLLNKHIEEGLPVAEMYYYGTEYNHSEAAYNWFRIGSDVRQHSFMFGRDKAIFYGSLKLSNALTLGQIGKDNIQIDEPEGDNEKGYEESAKYVNYKSLKESGDGTMFYDKDNKIVVIKVNGEWMKVNVEPLPDDIRYDF